MAQTKIYPKDPNATLDYSIDWGTNWLGADTIASSTWSVSSADLTIVKSSNTTTVTTVWISGGTAGNRYTVTNSIVTAGGRIEDRTFYLDVQNR